MTQRRFSIVRANVAVGLCSDGRVSHLRMILPRNAMQARGYWYGGGCVTKA